MTKALLIAGAALNFLFGLLHIFLGWQIWHAAAPRGTRALMFALNLGGMLLIFFLAYASAVCRREIMTTRLGRGVLVLAVLLYLSRAVEEVAIFGLSPAILVACLLVGGIYTVLLFRMEDRPREMPRAMAAD